MRKRHKKNRYRPYVRKLKPSDTAEDFRTALRLAFYCEVGKGYVLKQRGFKRFTMNVARTRRDAMETIAAVKFSNQGTGPAFREWSKRIRNRAQGALTI